MVGNGSKCYVYLDGELWAEAKTYKAISGTSIYINGWDTGTSYCSNNTDISDFRIYATALTETQIKELYRTSININGTNILPRDLE
jgi:isocitrate lyase